MTLTVTNPPQAKLSTREVCERGQNLYETKIRARIDTPENAGKLLTLDVFSGDYEVSPAQKHVDAMLRLQERRPAGAFYTLRIGFAAAFRSRRQELLPR